MGGRSSGPDTLCADMQSTFSADELGVAAGRTRQAAPCTLPLPRFHARPVQHPSRHSNDHRGPLCSYSRLRKPLHPLSVWRPFCRAVYHLRLDAGLENQQIRHHQECLQARPSSSPGERSPSPAASSIHVPPCLSPASCGWLEHIAGTFYSFSID